MDTVLKRSSVFSLILLVVGLIGLPISVKAAEWVYTVRPGDEIWNIASRYCGSATYADRIIEFNQLADERLIRPGARLRIPVEWLVRQPATAEVLSVKGTALLLTPEPEPARVGREIEMGHRLRTEDGSVMVGFADGSSLLVVAESEVLFNVLTAYGDTGMVDTNLRFYRGRGTSRVIRRNDASSFRISSPSGTAAVRGTEFRVAVDADRSLTETLEGEVGFVRDTEVSVPAGFGLAASPAGDVREQLLPAPAWASAPGRYALGDEIRWQPLRGAQGYRVSVFLTSDDQTPVNVTTRDTEALTLSDLPPASYRVAVRGISASELEGYESLLEVDLTNPAPAPSTPSVLETGATTLQWQAAERGPYRVEVAKDPTFSQILWWTEAEGRQTSPDLTPGNYFWRVKSERSSYSEPQSLKVRPQPPAEITLANRRMQLEAAWMHAGADEYRVRISLDAGFATPIVDTLVSDPAYAVQLEKSGIYHVEITARQHGVDSEPMVEQVGVYRRPWWLLGLLVVPFLL